MRRIELVHKEKDEQYREVLKSTIVDDEGLKMYQIDKNTLLKNLPEKIINEFLDFLNKQGKHREWMLKMIKEGKITLQCWQDEDPPGEPVTDNELPY